MTTTWSQVYSTSGSRCEERIRLTPLLWARSRIELEHLVAPLGVHAVGRLVEEQQIGIVHQRLRQLDALLHAGGVGFDVAVPRLAQADVKEHLVGALHRVDARQAGQLAAIGDEGHGVHARDVGVALRHVADAGPDLERRLRDVEAQHAQPAALRHDEPEQRLEHRALAGAVRPEQADGALRRTTTSPREARGSCRTSRSRLRA